MDDNVVKRLSIVDIVKGLYLLFYWVVKSSTYSRWVVLWNYKLISLFYPCKYTSKHDLIPKEAGRGSMYLFSPWVHQSQNTYFLSKFYSNNRSIVTLTCLVFSLCLFYCIRCFHLLPALVIFGAHNTTKTLALLSLYTLHNVIHFIVTTHTLTYELVLRNNTLPLIELFYTKK